MAMSRRRRLFFLFLSAILTIRLVHLTCLRSSDACTFDFWTSTLETFAKRSRKHGTRDNHVTVNLSHSKKLGNVKSKNLVNALRSIQIYSTLQHRRRFSSDMSGGDAHSVSNNTSNGSGDKTIKPDDKNSITSGREMFKNTTFMEEQSSILPKQVNSSASRDTNIKERLRIYDKAVKVKNQSCEPLYPQVVLYNRIFKTGSTTVSIFFEECSKTMNFDLKKDKTEDWSNESTSHPILKGIETSAGELEGKNRRLLVVAHFYFRDDIYMSVNYTYINLMRDPVERYISHYYYARSPLRYASRLKRLKERGHFNVSIEECLEKQYEGCTWNVMTRFFCGPEALCKTGNSTALEKAKYNLEHYYAIVGLLENINEFVEVLEKRLPQFVAKNPGLLEKKYVTIGVHKEPVSEWMMRRIASANRADIELYNFARTLFLKQARNCGVAIKK